MPKRPRGGESTGFARAPAHRDDRRSRSASWGIETTTAEPEPIAEPAPPVAPLTPEEEQRLDENYCRLMVEHGFRPGATVGRMTDKLLTDEVENAPLP